MNVKHYRPGTDTICDQPAMIFPLPDSGLCKRCFRECIQLAWDSDGASSQRLTESEWDEFVEIQLAGLNGATITGAQHERIAKFRRKLCDLTEAEDATAHRLVEAALT